MYDQFKSILLAELDKVVVGDPLDPATQVGPLANEAQLEKIIDQIMRTKTSGATKLYGKPAYKSKGLCYPHVFEDIPEGSPAAVEEFFGPVFNLYKVSSDQDAIKLANNSQYGLGAAIYSGSNDRALYIAGEIDTGMVFINETTRSDVRLPYGGVKSSGHGRDYGKWGFKEFTNAKTYWVA